MALSIERPSRTPIELVSEGVKGSIKALVKVWLWVMGALLVGAVIQSMFQPVFPRSVIPTYLGLVGSVGVFGYRYRRPFFWLWDQVRAGSAPDAAAPQMPTQEESGPVADVDDTVLGSILEDERDTEKVLCLPSELRNRHVYLIGKTRMGKTSLLKAIVQQDMLRGDGVCFLDPHGDAAEELLGLIPPSRIEDLIYFDPTRLDAPAFNPLALPFSPPKLTEDIVSVFLMLFGDAWGQRMEHLLRFGVLTLLADPAPRTLRDLRKLYLDDAFREEVLEKVESEAIREFWELEYPQMPKNSAAPILNKLSAFLAPMSDLERVFSQPENALDFAEILAEQKILIVNLAKGKLGEEPARLLGGLLVAGLQQAALARTAIPAEARSPFALTVDEFQNFTVASFESILAESAKYQVNLTLANQNLGQLSSSLERAIFGNCGTLVAFQVSADDAARLAREMHTSRIVVRRRESREFQPVEEFLAERREILRAALEDKYLGMDAAERREYRQREKQLYRDNEGFVGTFQAGASIGRMRAGRRIEIERMLSAIDGDDPLDVRTVSEIFPDFEVRELSFPEASDFTGIPPRHAFCRIGQSHVVAVIRCLPSELPDRDIREAVEEHLASLAPAAPPPTLSATRRAKPEPAPVAPEDFRE
jgi:hypothetical protein